MMRPHLHARQSFCPVLSGSSCPARLYLPRTQDVPVHARMCCSPRLRCLSCRLSPDPANPNQVFEGNDGQPMWPKPPLVKLEPSPKLFSLEGKGKTAQLVDNVERRRVYFAS